MADEDAEMIGGISVSVGASHAQLVSDLTRADQILEAWAKQKFVVNIGANVSAPAAGTRPAGPPPIVFGARATTGIQAAQGQTSMQRLISAELAKTGERLDANGDIVSATTNKIRAQKSVIVDVQQTAAQPAPLNIETGATQNDLRAVLDLQMQIIAASKEMAALPAPRVATAGGGSGGGGPRRPQTGRSAEFPEMEEPRGAARESATFALPLTQARQAQLEAERRAAAATPRVVRAAAPVAVAVAAPIVDAIEQERRRLVADLDSRRGRGAGGMGSRGASEEDIARRAEQRIASAESARVAQGRTARTSASGFGGQFLFGGPGREQTEAVARQSQAEQNLNRVRRLLNDPAIIRNARAYRHATEEQTVAEGELEKATKRVQDLSGPGTALRSLAAVTVAGAAFGIGLQVINTALDLTGKALTPAIDRMTGFATVSGRVTDALSDQTKKVYGNVQAVVASATAQAGLSARASAAIAPLVSEQAAIEASNKSLTESVDLFQTYTKARQQGLAGLNQNTGGFLGTGILGTPSTAQELGRLFQGLPSPIQRGPTTQAINLDSGIGGFNPFGIFGPKTTQVPNALQSTNIDLFNEGLKFANSQLEKGGEKILRFADAAADPDAVGRTVAAAQAAGAPDDFINSLRDGSIAISGLSEDAGEAASQMRRLWEAANIGSRFPDPGNLGQIASANEAQRQRESAASLDAIRSRQAFELPSIIQGLFRQQQFAANTQLPAQQFLQSITAPNVPVGTGIAAGDQASVASDLREAQDLQDQLNEQREKGRQIVADTYRPAILQNFGQAAVAEFDSALASVEATGQAIARIQAGISNKQAAYQVAQYNFQLLIAKRTLGDIGGLTGQNFGAGQSYLGVLERQNLQLSRQGQMLQFNLSQRQINFQTAVAGFSTPGVTPEERQANIRQAQIEASFAQKQLDIQREMFGNQVQIIDISNLRQGADLMRQIALLQQGRQVTIDTAAAQEQLQRLNQLQQRQVARVGTYLEAVNGVVTTAFGYISQLEAAAGKAMVGVATSVLAQFGIFINGLAGAMTGGGGFSSTRGHEPGQGGGLGGYAQGGMFNLSSPTRIGDGGIAGEVGDETLLILSRPRSATGTSGAGSVIINFTGDIHTSNAGDLDKITQAVMRGMGRGMSIAGLRSGG